MCASLHKHFNILGIIMNNRAYYCYVILVIRKLVRYGKLSVMLLDKKSLPFHYASQIKFINEKNQLTFCKNGAAG